MHTDTHTRFQKKDNLSMEKEEIYSMGLSDLSCLLHRKKRMRLSLAAFIMYAGMRKDKEKWLEIAFFPANLTRQ